jgi:hypothetical protein
MTIHVLRSCLSQRGIDRIQLRRGVESSGPIFSSSDISRALVFATQHMG